MNAPTTTPDATLPPFDPAPAIAAALGVPVAHVTAVLALLAEGNTVPFIARYRKEATSGLDEVQIREIQEQFEYAKELDARKRTILTSLAERDLLTNTLREQIVECATKTVLEDLYLPFKPKRRTRGMIARERGLAPLAAQLRELPNRGTPEEAARPFVDADKEVPDVESALAGARDIVAEEVAEDSRIRAFLRDAMAEHGTLTSSVVRGKDEEGAKFSAYFEHQESVARAPSHRVLAILRGEREGVLRVKIELDRERLLGHVRRMSGWRPGSPFSDECSTALEDSIRRLLHPSLQSDVLAELKVEADRAAVEVFAQNLENLLLAAPLGQHPVIGIDPGIRTGCKCVSLDATGRLLEHRTIFPVGRQKQERARTDLAEMVRRAKPRAIAVGNGTGGRETEAFVRETLRTLDLNLDTPIQVISVNESGASIYSASDIAREEFPDLDLTVRGAISIARRLQDPLAELVKLDPRSIGVGQYQHDVHQPTLRKKLDTVVEDCVNRVGVELNTASAPLLAYVAGIGPGLAHNIVRHREETGPFDGRAGILKVPGLGKKTYEQSAGFLRVRDANQPLDASAVHPERYGVVEAMARDLSVDVRSLVGDATLAGRIDIARYVDDEVGEPTLRDIVHELEKPGRDPREDFTAVEFREDVHSPEDLELGMKLQGVVTNVTDFGAFVDIGVHQDGLVHISQLADRFVSDPHSEVSVGQTIEVTVISVDLDRKRIGLSAKKDARPKT